MRPVVPLITLAAMSALGGIALAVRSLHRASEVSALPTTPEIPPPPEVMAAFVDDARFFVVQANGRTRMVRSDPHCGEGDRVFAVTDPIGRALREVIRDGRLNLRHHLPLSR